MVHRNIDELELEVEIEKGVAKARYELMGRNGGGGQSDEEEEEEEQGHGNRHQVEANRFMQYSNMRATDFPTVPRLMEPKHGTLKQENIIQKTKEELMEAVRTYRRKNCNSKGEIKKSNLQKEDKESLRELQKNVKDKKIVVFTTDKSGRFTIDTPQNYEKAVMKHTEKDEEITEDNKVKQIENKVNQHMKQISRIFRIGENPGHELRIAGAITSTNTPAPPMYGLRKDHKQCPDENEGPPVRPVCGANEAPNTALQRQNTFFSKSPEKIVRRYRRFCVLSNKIKTKSDNYLMLMFYQVK